MPTANNITFYSGTQNEYNSLALKNENGIYFLEDTGSIYKGNKKYGSNVKVATSALPGIVKPSSDFDIAADGTISLYKQIAIASFSHAGKTHEMGETLSSLSFSWALNKTPQSLNVTYGGTQTTTLANQSTGSHILTFASPIRATTNFTLKAEDARKATASKSTTVYFLNGKYYGASNISDLGQVNDSFIQGLSKQLTGSRTGVVNVTANAGQYIYFAIPTRFGAASFKVGGFEGGFDKIKTFDYTNKSGFRESYDVYRSTNAGLGATQVEVL